MRTFGEWFEVVSDKPGMRFFLTVRNGKAWVEAVDVLLCDLYGDHLQVKLDLWVAAQERGRGSMRKQAAA